MTEHPPVPRVREREGAEHTPLVSIVITAYNQAAFIDDAVESAQNQSVDDREIIVIDDGSTDGSADAISRWDGVTLVRQSNLGLSAARNRGLLESRGRYIVFLDADDRLLPNALEAGLACFGSHPEAAFVHGRYELIAGEGTFLDGPLPKQSDEASYRGLLRGNFIGMHATVMYRRSLLLEIDGFDVTLKACEDYEMYLRTSRRRPFASHESVVAQYRLHGANMSSDAALMLASVLRVLDSQRRFARRHPEDRRALRTGRYAWAREYAGRSVRQLLRSAGPDARHRLVSLFAAARSAPLPVMAALCEMVLTKGRRRRRGTGSPAVGHVRFGHLRRLVPISRRFGFDRGGPVDRYYIEAFLASHEHLVHGRVLEVGDDAYTRRFGGNRVERSDVLHVSETSGSATYRGDLSEGAGLPSAAFDCIILTQTLHLIYDVRSALATLDRTLRPGGTLLMTVPGTISQLEDGEWAAVWYWGFGERAMTRLCKEAFGSSTIEVRTHGNVLAAVAFLNGLAASELDPLELAHRDPLYPLLITVCVRKPTARSTAAVAPDQSLRSIPCHSRSPLLVQP